MKKLFALFLVVAMLSVAGTAMATVTVSPTTVTVAAGATATVTVTLSPDHDGTMSAPTTGADWVTVTASDDGYVATLKPTSTMASGDYVIRFRSTEVYADTTGHATHESYADLTVTVTNAASRTITYNPVPTGGTVADVKVISTTLASLPSRTQTFTTAVVTQVTNLITNYPEFKSTVVTILSDLLNGTVPADVAVQAFSNIEAWLSANYTEANSASVSVADANSDNLERAAAKLKLLTSDDNKRAIGVIPPFTVKAAGLQPMELSINKAFAGYKVGMNMGAYAITLASSVSTAAAPNGGNEVMFLTSADVSTDVIPADGKLTAIAYVETGVVYEPIVFVDLTGLSTASVDQFNEASSTSTKNVTVADESGVDAGILALIERGFVTVDTLGVYRLSWLAFKNGEAPAQVQSGTVYTWDIGLNFPVKTGGWRLYADGQTYSGEFEASASGIAATTSTDAKATIDVSDAALSVGTYTVTLGVIPASSDSDTEVIYNLGSVTKRSEDVGVGSSSGGCASMGSVLAVAVLGAFIAARKK